MKKKIWIVVLGLMMIAGATSAQEYKVAKSTGRLDIREVNDVTIEGHSGNEIIFTARGGGRDDDSRAKGLRAVSNMGLEDNTGIGLSVVTKGDVIEVQQMKKMGGPNVTIKVPKGVKVVVTHTSPHGSDVEIKNFEGAVEVSMVHNSVILTNTTGPLDIKTVHGDIDATLPANLTSPVSIVSVHGHVDVALPVGIKANIKLGTSWGEILVDPELKIEIDKSTGGERHSDRVTGKMNGGGLEIELASTHQNVYVRKK